MKNGKSQLIIRIVFIALSLLWMAVIFYLSAENSETSADTSEGLTALLQRIFYPSWSLASPEEYEKKMIGFHAIIRKIAHGTEFLILGALLAEVFVTFDMGWMKRFLFPFLIGSLYAVSDEYHQTMVPGRFMAGFDILIDSVGVFFGVITVLGITSMVLLSMEKKRKTTEIRR